MNEIKFRKWLFVRSVIHPEKWRLLDLNRTCVTPKLFNHWYEMADYVRLL